MIAIDRNATWDYVLKSERDSAPEEQTVWVLGYLTSAEKARIQDSLASADQKMEQIHICTGSARLETLRIGLKGFKNFREPNGSEIKPKITSDKMHASIIDKIPDWAQAELADAIANGSEVTDEDLGK